LNALVQNAFVRRTLAAAFFIVACLPTTHAMAGDKGNAEDLARQGIAEQEAGRHEVALTLFNRSLGEFDHPFTRFFKARSLVALARWVAGRELYRTLLAADETLGPKNHREVKESLARCERMLQETAVQVRTPPIKGARLLIDGRHQGNTPLVVRLRRGHYELRVEKEGYEPVARTIEVAGEPRLPLDLSLTPTPSSPTSPSSIDGAVGAPSARRPWAWTTLGVGAAMTAAGAGFLGNWASHQGDTLKDGQCLAGEGLDLAIGGSLAGVGLAGVGVGLYLLLREGAEAPPVALGLVPLPGQGAFLSFAWGLR
jgi:PEGA domain